jgi:hypothetical protein
MGVAPKGQRGAKRQAPFLYQLEDFGRGLGAVRGSESVNHN